MTQQEDARREDLKELAPPLKAAERGDLKPFDKRSEKSGASPYDCSGLPPLEKLEKDDDYSSCPVGRVSHHQIEVKKRLREKKERKVKKPRPKHADPEMLVPRKVAALEESGRNGLFAGIHSDCTLSARAKDQFVLPQGQKLRAGEIPTGKGFSDLYSGVKGVAGAIADLGNCWSITCEIEDGANQNQYSVHGTVASLKSY